MHTALVTNPSSGGNKRDAGLRERLLAAMGPDTLDVAPEGPEGWEALAQHLLDEGVEAVGVSGGDGTLHCLLTGLAAIAPAERWPAVALLRSGTMNTLAANLGLRGRPEVLAAGIDEAVPVPIPCMQVGKHVGFLFGVGVPVDFLKAYYAGRTGPVGGALLLGRVAGGLFVQSPLFRRIVRPHALRVTVDGATWEVDRWRAVGANTVPSLGLGFQVCPHTPTPERLEVYGFGGIGWSIVRNLPRIRMGLGLRGANALQGVAEGLVIEGDEDIAYMIDGDLFEGGRRLEVRVGGPVRFLRPAGTRGLIGPGMDRSE